MAQGPPKFVQITVGGHSRLYALDADGMVWVWAPIGPQNENPTTGTWRPLNGMRETQ